MTASASSAATQQLPPERSCSLQADDTAKSESGLGAAQESVDGIKAYVSLEQDADSGPHSPKDIISGAHNPSAKDAVLRPNCPVPEIDVSGPHNACPKDAALGSCSPFPKDAVSGPCSPIPRNAVPGPHSPFCKDAVSRPHSPSLKDDEEQRAGTEQRLRTPPRRERLQGNWSTVCTCIHQTCIYRHIPSAVKLDITMQ